MKNHLVIAIAGISGSGKTCITKSVAKHFRCKCLHFDDYVDKNTYPQDMLNWLEQGADLHQIKTPNFARAIRQHIKSNTGLLLVEEPFGTCRQEVAALIDKTILLDVPLAICLSRVIERRLKCASALNKGQVLRYLASYQAYLYQVYQNTYAQTKSVADTVINNQQQADTAVTDIIEFITNVKEEQ